MEANETYQIAEIKGIIHPKTETTNFYIYYKTLMWLLIVCCHLNCQFVFLLHVQQNEIDASRANYSKIQMDIVATVDFY